MQVTKIDSFPSPVWLLDDFLTPENAAKCLQECHDLKRTFMPSSVGAGTDNRRDSKVRTNKIVMLDTIYSADRKSSDILTLIGEKTSDNECRVLWHEGDLIFDVINYATWKESVLSCYGDNDFYSPHQDTVYNPQCRSDITHRLVTMCYYMNTEPCSFTGGNLVLIKDSQELTLEAKHNRAIVFPSFTVHKVTPVSIPKDQPWTDSRFSLNYWLGFK